MLASEKIGPTTTQQKKVSFSNSRSIFCENIDELSSKHDPEKDRITIIKSSRVFSSFFRLFLVLNAKSSPAFVMSTFFPEVFLFIFFSDKFSTKFFLLSKKSLLLSLQFRKEGLKAISIFSLLV